MLRIRFKDVGQGDSVILEWEQSDEKCIAIIDCKRYHGKNPVLEYIKEIGCKRIEFMVLSHPHIDHCSGFIDLITHCLNEKIKIKYFLFTGELTQQWYYAATVNNTSTQIYVFKLYELLRKCSEDLLFEVNNVEGASIRPTIQLNQHLKLDFLAPTSRERNKFLYGNDPKVNDEEPGNAPKANWLSTIIKIFFNDSFILLTSDVNSNVLEYYDKHRPDELKGRMILAQSPHHGSKANHNNTFWRKRKIKGQSQAIVFSVGDNKHGHPSQEVVEFFADEKFDIYSTNQIGPLLALQATSISKSAGAYFDSFSFRDYKTSDSLNGDKVFHIDNTGFISPV
jgi:beta-lactamase superfamily II metal-dependent hydrolase